MANSFRAAITGMGAAVPDKVMSNADFERILDTSDEWITKRTGIKQRRICSEGESTADLAARAARKALEDAGCRPDQLDLIICATITPEMPFPATACFVQRDLGATDVPAFDISAACSGFVYALSVGTQFVETGMYKRVLVIGVDVLSRFCDYTDRGSCILFGDGAGAVVLEATENRDTGVQFTCMNADGQGWDYIHVPAGGSKLPTSEQTLADGGHFVKLRGRDVYKFAVEKMQWLLGHCMEQCDLSVDQIDMVVPHQVNIRIIQSATEKFDFPMDKIFLNLDKYGNTSGASVPLALAEAAQSGRVGPGSTVVLVAFGAGLTWAGAVVKL